LTKEEYWLPTILNGKSQIPEQAAKAESGQVRNILKRSIRTASQLMVIALGNGLVWFKTRKLKLFLL